ncbi:MAG: hypothetical protein IJW86_07105 [Clostridia bacterium]|nr:hypothetical protein [Clostridia bacterium]
MASTNKAKNLFGTIIIPIILIIFLFIFSGCGISGVETEQLKKDLNSYDDIQNCFTSDYTEISEYEITECTIVDNIIDKENEKNIIYCLATANNNYFKVNLDVKVTYIRINSEWQLSDVSYFVDDVIAIAPPEVSQVERIVSDGVYEFDRFSYGIKDEDESSTHYYYLDNYNYNFDVIDITLNDNYRSAKVNCSCQSMGATYYGYYEMSLSMTGWQILQGDSGLRHMTLSKMDFDYATKAVGEFYHSYEDEYAYLKIHEIVEDKIVYTLLGNDSILINCEFDLGENLTAEFDSEFGQFLEIHYSPEEDMWEFGALELKRKN